MCSQRPKLWLYGLRVKKREGPQGNRKGPWGRGGHSIPNLEATDQAQRGGAGGGVPWASRSLARKCSTQDLQARVG